MREEYISRDYFFNIPTRAHDIYNLKSIKNTQKLAPTCFGPIFKTIIRGLVDITS
jgi:hypothetical protein